MSYFSFSVAKDSNNENSVEGKKDVSPQGISQRLTNANTVLHAYVSASVFGGVRTSAVIGFRSPCVD